MLNVNCNLRFTISGFSPSIYTLFTFHFSLFTSFFSELWCKYRNNFVTLHPKSEKISIFSENS